MSASTIKERTAALSLAALGVVYGDIGTSPLYAMKEIFGGAHHPVPITPDNVLGILSLFFWSLIIVVTLKYVAFIMRANNKGEGGIIALMTLALHNGDPASRRQRLLIALGLYLIFGIPLFPAGLITAVVAFGILGLEQRGYRRFELAIIALLGLVGAGFIYVFFAAGDQDYAGIAGGLILSTRGHDTPRETGGHTAGKGAATWV